MALIRATKRLTLLVGTLAAFQVSPSTFAASDSDLGTRFRQQVVAAVPTGNSSVTVIVPLEQAVPIPLSGPKLTAFSTRAIKWPGKIISLPNSSLLDSSILDSVAEQVPPAGPQFTPQAMSRLGWLREKLFEADGVTPIRDYKQYLELENQVGLLKRQSSAEAASNTSTLPNSETTMALKLAEAKLIALRQKDEVKDIIKWHDEFTALSKTPASQSALPVRWESPIEEWTAETGWAARELGSRSFPSGSGDSWRFDLKKVSVLGGNRSNQDRIGASRGRVIGLILVRRPSIFVPRLERGELLKRLRNSWNAGEPCWLGTLPLITSEEHIWKEDEITIHASFYENHLNWNQAFVFAIILERDPQ